MYAFLEDRVPDYLQEQVLTELKDMPDGDVSPLPPAIHQTYEWFTARIMSHSQVRRIGFIAVEALHGGKYKEFGRAPNSDIHADSASIHKMPRVLKYMVTLANNPRSGTIFFNNDFSLQKYRSEELFDLNNDRLLPKPDLPIEFDYQQVGNGQLCAFDLHQLHAAAPQFKGDHKVLLSTVIRIS